jgi:histidyl-tRNA synthetase
MADKQSTKPPAGTRDFLPDEIRRRQYVMGVVRDVYESYGFAPLETPAFENIETLLGKYGDEGNKLIFKILKRGEHERTGEADLALRYDLTVPLARVVAQYQNEIPRFFKRYQIQPVWRADRPARGRFREFFQCDIDALGSTSPIVEAGILGAVCEVLARLGFRDFAVRLNDRRVLTALLETAGVPPPQHGEALVAIDKLDKIGADGVAREFAARGIPESAMAKTLTYFAGGESAAPEAALTRLRDVLPAHEAIANLTAILGLAGSTPAAGRIRIDPSLARGLSYYTGAIMEVAVPDLAGSLGGGGRYDNLVGMFLGRDVPACGFSLGLERIIVLMTERKMFPDTVARGAVDILVTMWDDAVLRAQAVALAAELRQNGLRVEVYPEPDKLGKQFKYASDRKVPFVAIQGGDETSAGQVTIKDLADGQQFTVPRAEAGLFVVGRMNLEPRT